MAGDTKPAEQTVETAGAQHSSEESAPRVSEQTQAPVLDPKADAPKAEVKDEPAKDAPKPEDKPAEEERKTLGDGVNPDDVVPVDHEDVNIRAVQSILADAKVTEAEAFSIFGKAVQSGNLSDIDTAALVAKLGESKAQLALAGVQQWHATVYASIQATQKIVHDAFGGEKGWDAAKVFFQSKESDPAVIELRGMLDKGGIHAELAVERMVKMYTADPNTKTGNLPLNIQNMRTNQGPTQIIADRKEFVKLLEQCRTVEERRVVQTNWIDSKRSRGEL